MKYLIIILALFVYGCGAANDIVRADKGFPAPSKLQSEIGDEFKPYQTGGEYVRNADKYGRFFYNNLGETNALQQKFSPLPVPDPLPEGKSAIDYYAYCVYRLSNEPKDGERFAIRWCIGEGLGYWVGLSNCAKDTWVWTYIDNRESDRRLDILEIPSEYVDENNHFYIALMIVEPPVEGLFYVGFTPEKENGT